jgi:ABC-2 type transport system ATP-binding protein
MAETSPPILSVKGLVKQFGQGEKALKALKGVSFDVPKGSVYTILGPNGAGKTTLLRILSTLMRPNAGTAFLDGEDILKNPISVKRKMGVVFQENHFDEYLNIWEGLRVHAMLHGMLSEEALPRIEMLLKKVGLWERRDAIARRLSGGQQRRIALIRALLHSPKLLFLDEPSTGLDPQARRDIWEMILNFKQTETVILTTHYMEEADQLSDYILMMDEGQVVMTGTAKTLKSQLAQQNRYEVVLTHPVELSQTEWFRQAGLSDLTQMSPDTVQFNLAESLSLCDVLQSIPPSELVRMGKAEVDLETVFMEVAEGRLRQAVPHQEVGQ